MAYLTDQELLERFEYYTLQIEQRLLEGEDPENFIDVMPCMVVLSRSEAIEIEYTNKKHQEVTGYSLEQMREECPTFLNDIIHPASLENIQEFLPYFYENEASHQTMFFIQYAQLFNRDIYSPLITFTKVPRKSDGLVIRMPLQLQEFGKMSKMLEQIIRMDEFKLKHFKQFQQLTDREVEVLSLLANGFNNPKIADKLFISRQTVETHRKNLKRKLELRSFRDLMRYAFAFNLVEV